jgi:hypothetical protein
VLTLDDAHQLRVALPSAAMLGSHLRWGLRFMYRRDIGLMRDDNIVDYPWLLFSVLAPMRAYARLQAAGASVAQRERVVEALLDGLSADPWAFRDTPPSALAHMHAEHGEFRELFTRHQGDLFQEFDQHKPSRDAYSPLGFACNFLLNAVVGTVGIMLSEGVAQPSLNALFTRSAGADSAAEAYARKLMSYALGDRQRLDASGAPLIVYDHYDGLQHYNRLIHAYTAALPTA